MEDRKIRQELEALFGEEEVRIAEAQEYLARRYTTRYPYVVREALQKFQRLRTFEQQKKLVQSFDKEVARAFICAFLCQSASQAVMDLATQAIDDKRSGRAVLGGKILQR